METLDKTLLDATLDGDVEAVKEALQNGASVNCRDKKGWTPLHMAAAGNNTTVIPEYLVDVGAKINAKTDNGQTPLHVAAWNNATDISEFFINSSANLNATDDEGQTPLHVSTWNNAPAISEQLILAEADVNVKDNQGLNPIHWEAGNNTTTTLQLLIQCDAIVNTANNEGWTSLHWAAAYSKSASVLELLITEGADTNARNNLGQTPVDIAAQYNTKAVSEILKQLITNHNAKKDEVGLRMEDPHRKILQTSFVFLTENIYNVEEVCDYLMADEVFTRGMVNNIQHKRPKPTAQVRELISTLLRRRKIPYESFIHALTNTGNHDSADFLMSKEPEEWPNLRNPGWYFRKKDLKKSDKEIFSQIMKDGKEIYSMTGNDKGKFILISNVALPHLDKEETEEQNREIKKENERRSMWRNNIDFDITYIKLVLKAIGWKNGGQISNKGGQEIIESLTSQLSEIDKDAEANFDSLVVIIVSGKIDCEAATIYDKDGKHVSKEKIQQIIKESQHFKGKPKIVFIQTYNFEDPGIDLIRQSSVQAVPTLAVELPQPVNHISPVKPQLISDQLHTFKSSDTGTQPLSPTKDNREPPIFVKELHDIDVTEGDLVELKIEVKGTPPIEIVWVHNNSDVTGDHPFYRTTCSDNIQQLVIPKCKMEDSGEFVCEAYNEYGEIDTFCRVNVNEISLCEELDTASNGIIKANDPNSDDLFVVSSYPRIEQGPWMIGDHMCASYFIQALIHIFSNHAYNKSFLDLMEELQKCLVNAVVPEMTKDGRNKDNVGRKHVADVVLLEHSKQKELYLFPGFTYEIPKPKLEIIDLGVPLSGAPARQPSA